MARQRGYGRVDQASSSTLNVDHGTEDAHEGSPLLSHGETAQEGQNATLSSSSSTPLPEPPLEERLSRDVILSVALYCILCALIEAGSMFFYIPITQIYEDIICRNIRDQARMGQGYDCASDKIVQGELATLMGWGATIGIIPGLVVAIPYGLMADRFGHKLVICLSVLGMTLSELFKAIICSFPNVFPLRLIWAASTMELIGGGSSVLNAVLFATISDRTPEAYRSSMFFYVGSVDIAVRLVTSPAAGLLMDVNVWLPVGIGLACSIAGVAFSCFLPSAPASGKHSASSNIDPEVHHDEAEESHDDQQQQQDSSHHSLRKRLTTSLQQAYASIIVVAKGNRNMILMLLTIMITTVGWDAQGLFLQYARAKYGWPWSAGGYLVSIKSAITVLLLSVVLPALTHVMTTKFRIAPARRDLNLARISCVLMMTGSLVTGLSTTSVMMTIGYAVEAIGGAYNLLLRSLIKTFVDDAHTALLFNAVAMLETVGSLIAWPLLAMLFRVGLDLGGGWMGLPFLVGSGLSAVAVLVLCVVRL